MLTRIDKNAYCVKVGKGTTEDNQDALWAVCFCIRRNRELMQVICLTGTRNCIGMAMPFADIMPFPFESASQFGKECS